MILTREQINRYLRHIIMPEISGAGQKKLLESSVGICGECVRDMAAAVYYLAGAGIGRIACRFDDGNGLDKLFADVRDLNGDVSIEQDSGGPVDLRIYLGSPAFLASNSDRMFDSFVPSVVSVYNGWEGGLQVFNRKEDLQAFLDELPNHGGESGPDAEKDGLQGGVFSSCLLGALSDLEIIKLALDIGETAKDFLFFNLYSMEFVKTSRQKRKHKLKELSACTETNSPAVSLADRKVLIVGAGGLGAPVAYALAWAGVGTLGLVDFDDVEVSNLHRQFVHATSRIGLAKTESATIFLKSFNPSLNINSYKTALTKGNVFEIIKGYDIVVDALDNFPTRFLLNDACFFAKKPLVDAGVIRFDGTCMTILNPGGACYRCRYPEIPAAGSTPSCSEVGVLGPLPGIMGFIQGAEVFKYLAGQGELLSDRIIFFDGLFSDFCTIKLSRKSTCPLCGTEPSIHELQDYTFVCADTARE